jgi:FixJ family two-component response regulator
MSSIAPIANPAISTPGLIPAFNQDLNTRTTPPVAPIIFVVDDDIHVQQSLEQLIRSRGWQPQLCNSAQEFLARPRPFVPSTLILAFSFAGSSSLEVQKRIARECPGIPIVIVADNKDIPTTVQAMKAGAVDYLIKPLRQEPLVAAIRQSLARSRAALDQGREMHELRSCHGSLTLRERQVMALVVAGLLNKQIGAELGISEITVKAHRGQVMQKMKASSLAHLVNMALRLRIPTSKAPSSIPK